MHEKFLDSPIKLIKGRQSASTVFPRYPYQTHNTADQIAYIEPLDEKEGTR